MRMECQMKPSSPSPFVQLTHAEHAVAVDDFFRLMFSFPSVQGILQWGFWDKVGRVSAKVSCSWVLDIK